MVLHSFDFCFLDHVSNISYLSKESRHGEEGDNEEKADIKRTIRTIPYFSVTL